MAATLKIYNSLTKQKEEFKSINPGVVGMYVCGPTVSGESHLGHCRPYVTFDVLYRLLMHLGYKVRYVRNITDAGHFEEEGRAAEDKVAEKAKLEKLEPMELVQKYTNMFHDAMDALNNLRPSIEPTATGHIIEQIEMIKDLINKGYAYEKNGSVYFEVRKYAARGDYGKLSGRVIEELFEATRDLDGQEEKKDPVDFALWKAAPPEHIMRWQSPWGEGFPGWHIECSAMSTKYLGKHFDIHGGGMDLQFPHHESEIAQSEICNGCMPVRYWMHNNMITVAGKKMGKSYNNQITLSQMFTGNHHLLTKAFSPITIRFLVLQSHYRSPLDFSSEALEAAEKAYKRLMDGTSVLNALQINNANAADKELEEKLLKSLDEMDENICDDLSTAKVLAIMFDLLPIFNGLKGKTIPDNAISTDALNKAKQKFNVYINDILGLYDKQANNKSAEKLEDVINILIDLRSEAKAKKDFVTSDNIRNKLLNVGIQLKDEKDGSVSYTF